MIVISFDSTSYAMTADKCFGEEQFEKMVIPTPRAISNSCGISLQIQQRDIQKALELIQTHNLKIKGIYEINNNTATKLY